MSPKWVSASYHCGAVSWTETVSSFTADLASGGRGGRARLRRRHTQLVPGALNADGAKHRYASLPRLLLSFESLTAVPVCMP